MAARQQLRLPTGEHQRHSLPHLNALVDLGRLAQVQRLTCAHPLGREASSDPTPHATSKQDVKSTFQSVPTPRSEFNAGQGKKEERSADAQSSSPRMVSPSPMSPSQPQPRAVFHLRRTSSSQSFRDASPAPGSSTQVTSLP